MKNYIVEERHYDGSRDAETRERLYTVVEKHHTNFPMRYYREFLSKHAGYTSSLDHEFWINGQEINEFIVNLYA